jgi:hypothetical protein
LRGGSSSSKLVREDPYPYSVRFFIRSRKVDEDPDPDEYDPELVLDLDDASERRGSGSGGTSGTSTYDDDEDDGPPREGIIFANERCGRTERVGGARVDVPVLRWG